MWSAWIALLLLGMCAAQKRALPSLLQLPYNASVLNVLFLSMNSTSFNTTLEYAYEHVQRNKLLPNGWWLKYVHVYCISRAT